MVMKIEDEIMIGYENCANAIIVKAAQDYKSAYKRIMAGKARSNHEHTAQECEDFFESEWYAQLTAIDGEEMMHMVRAQALKEMRRNK